MADDLDTVEAHREFLLTALRAATTRARLIEADLTTIGTALKGNMIGPDTAVRWIMNSGLLWIVGDLPESVGKVAATGATTNESNPPSRP